MIYFDNAATTRPCPACVAAVSSMLTDHFANPSSLHGPGIDAMKEIIAARSALADALGVERDTLTFTSGGTEANNLALFGAAYANRRRGKRIVTTAIEHESIIQTADQLEAEGFEVVKCGTVARAFAQMEQHFDLYILDLALPDGSGMDVCRAIKERWDRPVVFLTASDEEVSVVMGLEMGADDYIAKPFRLRELTARIKNILRRYQKNTGDCVRLGNVSVMMGAAKVFKNGQEVLLTAMEYRLLLILLQQRGLVLSRNTLLEQLWDVDGAFVGDNTLTVYIKRLRDKIEDDPANPKIIKTVRGLGYRIDHEEL